MSYGDKRYLRNNLDSTSRRSPRAAFTIENIYFGKLYVKRLLLSPPHPRVVPEVLHQLVSHVYSAFCVYPASLPHLTLRYLGEIFLVQA